MRVAVSLLAAILAFLPAATAQDPDGPPGCVEGNPCDLILAVDADGFSDVSETEFATGTWVVATLVNHDDAEHTVSLASHSLSIIIPGGDIIDSDPFRMGPIGTYTLSDEPSGDTVDFTSVEESEFEGNDDDAEEENGIPGPSGLVAFAAVAVAALVLRRKA